MNCGGRCRRARGWWPWAAPQTPSARSIAWPRFALGCTTFGAQVFLDAVHYAPHAVIDVARWNCDYLACSAYKFFGPHVGILWGRPELLTKLPAYKVRPAADSLPDKWMTGTQSHEGIAGVLAAIEYLADLGRQFAPAASNRHAAIVRAFDEIGRYERTLCDALLAGLAELGQVRVWGLPITTAGGARADGVDHARAAKSDRIGRLSGRAPDLRLARKLLRAGTDRIAGAGTSGARPAGLAAL